MSASATSTPPTYIVGAPRSGTSLVYRVLALHPQAAWVNNYHRRLPRVPALAALDRIAAATPRTRHRVWFGAHGDNAYRYAGHRSLLERFYPQPVEGEPVFRAHDVPEDGPAGPTTPRQRGLVSTVDAVCRAAGAPVFVSKRIGHNRRIGLLHSIDPSARFLDVTRDGRAVADSLVRVDWWPDLEVWWRGGERPGDWVAAGGDPLELASRHWVAEVDAIDAGLAGVPAEQVLRVRYEDLVADPLTLLPRMAQFCGLDPSDPAWVRAVHQVRFPNRNRTSSGTTPYLDVLGGHLEAKGYPL